MSFAESKIFITPESETKKHFFIEIIMKAFKNSVSEENNCITFDTAGLCIDNEFLAIIEEGITISLTPKSFIIAHYNRSREHFWNKKSIKHHYDLFNYTIKELKTGYVILYSKNLKTKKYETIELFKTNLFNWQKFEKVRGKNEQSAN